MPAAVGRQGDPALREHGRPRGTGLVLREMIDDGPVRELVGAGEHLDGILKQGRIRIQVGLQRVLADPALEERAQAVAGMQEDVPVEELAVLHGDPGIRDGGRGAERGGRAQRQGGAREQTTSPRFPRQHAEILKLKGALRGLRALLKRRSPPQRP